MTDLRKCREPKGLVKELAVDLSTKAAADLVREAADLVKEAVNLVREAVNLVRKPTDLVREAVNLVREYQFVHSGLLESSLTF